MDIPNRISTGAEMKGTLQRTLFVMLLAYVFLAIGCNGLQDTVSPQKVIDSEVEKVMLDVSDKMEITTSELTKDKITALGYASGTYGIEYRDIKSDVAKGTVSVTFILKKASLQSKTRTVTITGFKVKGTSTPIDPSKPSDPQKSNDPSIPPVPGTESTTIQEAVLLSAVGLIKGEQTASAAAKAIATKQDLTVDALTLTKAQALSYDDEAGTFTVKVKGTKGGKPFEQELSVTGFTHPYASALTSVKTCAFNLDAAIEDNLSIDKYIEKITPEIRRHLTFEVRLENNQLISLGDTDAYRFTAKVRKDGTQLKVSNINYVLKYKKCITEGTETVEEKPYGIMQNVVRQQKKPYFTEDDVFKYVLSKTDESFITVSNGEFASSFSAFAKAHGNMENLLDVTKIQRYIDRYAPPRDADKHLAVKIAAGLYNAKHGGISADDSEGTLTLRYCITTNDKLANHITTGLTDGTIKAISQQITKSGFRKADAETLKQLFEFKVEKQGGGTAADAQAAWSAYQFSAAGDNLRLLSEDYTTQNFPSFDNEPFRITINAEDNPQNVFAVEHDTHLSKGSDDVKILLNGVYLNKTADTTDLKAIFVLSNGENVDVTYPHAIH